MEFHSMATAELRTMFPEAGKPQVERSIVIPQALTLRVWDGIVETKDEVTRVPVHVFLQPASVDSEPLMMKRSPPSNIQIDAARAPAAAALLRFARIPVTRVEQLPSGYAVTFLDFRFYREANNSALAAKVVLDESLRITTQDLSFVRSLN
jgi:hypothetical protein